MSTYVLKRFGQLVKAVDQADPAVEDRVREIFNQIVEGIETCYYEVSFRDSQYDRSEGEKDEQLKVAWCSYADREDKSRPIIKDGNYTDQTSYAHAKGRTFWIKAKSDDLLNSCDSIGELCFVDEPPSDIPTYEDYSSPGKAKTSILIPLERNGFTVGVMGLEFAETIDRSKEAAAFLSELAQIVVSYFDKKKSASRNLKDTNEAFSELAKDIDTESIRLPGEKLDVFFGFGGDADESVVNSIKSRLKGRYGEKINLCSWDEMNDSGQINLQLSKKIFDADFALFYLSEPSQNKAKNKVSFQDNPNVLFECGIAHGKFSSAEQGAERWLAIREDPKLTTRAPFDISVHRMIHVARSEGKVETKQLNTELDEALKGLLSN